MTERNSFFYIDPFEVDMLFNQFFEGETEKEITTEVQSIVRGEAQLHTPNFFGALIESQIGGEGETGKSVIEKLRIETSLSDKIAFLQEKYPLSVLDGTICDGEIVCFQEYLTLRTIDVENHRFENFDGLYDFEYKINRLRTHDCIFSFEKNRLALCDMGYEEKNQEVSTIKIRMSSSKVVKDIQHYSKKIQEYTPFLFYVLGEANRIKNGFAIKPFVVWRNSRK